MSRPFLFNSVAFVTIIGLYCGYLREVLGTDDGIVHIALQKSQDVSPKANIAGSDLKINNSMLIPSELFKDQVSIIEGQLNVGLDALNKNNVDKDKLDVKPASLDVLQGQIGIKKNQINKDLDAFQASTKQPGQNTEKQAQNAYVQNINKTTPLKENRNTQDGAQVKQNSVQKSTNAEATTQDSSTESSQKYEDVDSNSFTDSPDTSDPEVTDFSSELSVEFTSSFYPFSQVVGGASGENGKPKMLDSIPNQDDLQDDDNDDGGDDDDFTMDHPKLKWPDAIAVDEDEEKNEKDENDDYVTYDDEDKVTTASEEDYEENPKLHNPNHFDSNIDIMQDEMGNGKFKVKENFVANRPITAEQSMVSFYTWILLVIMVAMVTFLIFKNRHKVQGYILQFNRKWSNGSKVKGEETKKLMSHEYA